MAWRIILLLATLLIAIAASQLVTSTGPWFYSAAAYWAVGITLVMVARLLLRRPEALVLAGGLGAIYLLGFAGPLLPGVWDGVLVAFGLMVATATIVLVGRVAPAPWAAALACAAFVPLALLLVVLGNYTAYETGWRGLSLERFASSDHPGFSHFAWGFVISLPVWVTIGMLIGALVWLISTSRPPPSDLSNKFAARSTRLLKRVLHRHPPAAPRPPAY